ncbi:hypothetical protein F2Q68_00010589 [Brassica cretica]|uniref:Uncharacterized protein n=1 Tax=Brassica cretica TaxID=69181 RepID=A0A8S9KY55_BRACR|nr:hypothetical protein F2Q68_00010589 [Brassica cretica]
MRDNFLDSELSALRNSEALFSTCSVSMTGTRLPDERAQAVRSLGSLLNYVRLDPRKGMLIDLKPVALEANSKLYLVTKLVQSNGGNVYIHS